jgi:hypothetical protein
MNMDDPAQALINASKAMFDDGTPLMRRLIPAGAPVCLYDHYPDSDIVNGPQRARYFYHCHDPSERGDGEHGHFHLFVDKAALAGFEPLLGAPAKADDQPDVVQIAALSITPDGLPLAWFATNQWVTDEWVYPASAITTILPHISFEGVNGDPLVNAWLTAMVRLSAAQIANLLRERDIRFAEIGQKGDDQSNEVLAISAIDLETLVG